MVFKSIRSSRSATAATCVFGTREWIAKQDHPAYIPRPAEWALIRPSGQVSLDEDARLLFWVSLLAGCTCAWPRRHRRGEKKTAPKAAPAMYHTTKLKGVKLRSSAATTASAMSTPRGLSETLQRELFADLHLIVRIVLISARRA